VRAGLSRLGLSMDAGAVRLRIGGDRREPVVVRAAGQRDRARDGRRRGAGVHGGRPAAAAAAPRRRGGAMIIDVFAHLLTPRYLRERNARAGAFGTQYAKYWSANPGLTDLDIRFRGMDPPPAVPQILTNAGPNIESITKPADSVECARIANDEMAELVARHPDRFVTA